MVNILASRAAGYKLGLALFLLLVPIGYFGTVLTLDSLRKFGLAQANGAAVNLVDITFRSMIDLTRGWSVSDQQSQLLAEGPDLAKTAGVLPEFEILRDVMLSNNPDRGVTLAKANELLLAMSDGPLLNEAGNREANAMARAGGMLLPSILMNYRDMQALADGSMLSVDMATKNVVTLSGLASALAQSSDEFKSSIKMARAYADKSSDYSFLQRNSVRLSKGSDGFKALVFDQQIDPLSKMQQAASALRTANSTLLSDILTTWVELHDRLSAISDARMSELRFWIARTLGWSVASVVFSLCIAAHMFRSTLTKLDEVENARKQAEAARYVAENGSSEMEKLNTDLAAMNHEVSQHMKALEDAQEQLVKKGRMEQMGQLTATMAHELRNPLGAARTSIFLLERKTRDKGLGVESQIQRITNAIMRCDDIITQLLDFSRTKKLSPTSANFDDWLERTVTEEAMHLPQALSISCQLGTAGVPIAFDPSRMQRALTNLLNNASEAMVGNGDDTTKFRVADPRIEITSTIVGGMLSLRVSDNGPGISPENLARVKEPLFTTKSFGTGLGLPAVEQIAAQHGGTVHISSEIGKGTTATILLPLEAQADAA